MRSLGLWLIGRLVTKERVTDLMRLLEQLMLDAAEKTATPVDEAVLRSLFDSINEDELADMLERVLRN